EQGHRVAELRDRRRRVRPDVGLVTLARHERAEHGPGARVPVPRGAPLSARVTRVDALTPALVDELACAEQNLLRRHVPPCASHSFTPPPQEGFGRYLIQARRR